VSRPGALRAALSLRLADATAAFNVGVALEDLGATGRRDWPPIATAPGCDPQSRTPLHLARLLDKMANPHFGGAPLVPIRQLTKKR